MDKDKETQDTRENALKQIKLLLMIVLVIAIVAPLLSTTMTVNSINAKLSGSKTGDEKEEHAEKVHKELPMAFYKPMEFLVNLGDIDANHYLRSTVSLGLRPTEQDMAAQGAQKKGGGGHGKGGDEENVLEPALFKTIKTQEPIVRDIIISVISNYTMDKLVTTAGKKELKETIRQKLRQELHNEYLEVYFTSFTLQ